MRGSAVHWYVDLHPRIGGLKFKVAHYRRFGPLEIVAAPNVTDPVDFAEVSREGETVRIGYCGTRTHGADMPLVMPGFAECAKITNTEILFWGWHPKWKEATAPRAYESQGIRYKYEGQINDLHEFVKRIGVLDVAVAPLATTEFNAAKSPQKWFEHSLNRTAMVLSDSPAYDCVEHGVTGFKAKTAEEFTHYMRLLVENAELRRRMGEAARNTVMTRHTVAQWGQHWRRALSVDDVGQAIPAAVNDTGLRQVL